MPKNTRSILRSIQSYAIAAIILTASITTVVAIFPLYLKLETIEKKNVVFSRDIGVFIIDHYLLRLKDAARQISNEKSTNQLLDQYQQGKINKTRLTQTLNSILLNALRSNTHLVGITRIDLHGNIVAEVGKPIPHTLWQIHQKMETQVITGPITQDKHDYIAILTPLFSQRSKTKIGMDVTLFDVTDLYANLSQHTENEVGETLIGYQKDDKIHILFHENTKWGKSIQPHNALYKALYEATVNRKVNLIQSKINNESIIIAHAPSNQSQWGVAVIVEKTELMAALRRTLWSIVGIITFVIIIFIAGLKGILKPVSSRILIAQHDLEERIKKGQSALQKANKKLQHLVEHDYLTGVLNRRGFDATIGRELSRAKRHNQSFLLLYLDINNFKQINDELGHHAGDIVLKTIAERLSQVTRQEDSIARLGGDEFAIIAPIADQQHSVALEEKIKNSMLEPVRINHDAITCSISIGTATFPTDGIEADTLMRHADRAMYADKKRHNQ